LTKPLPEGSRITVDTNMVPPTAEGVLTVKPGSHVIRVRAPGYRSARRTVAVGAGDTTSLDLVLLPLPVPDVEAQQIDTTTGAIVLKGDLPAGAVVRVDGRVVAPGLRVLTVPPGSHWVTLAAPGRETDSSRVEVQQGSWSEWPIPELARSLDHIQETVSDSGLPVQPQTPSADVPLRLDSAPDYR